VPSDGKALLIDASGLLALDQLVASLTRTVKLEIDDNVDRRLRKWVASSAHLHPSSPTQTA
jgi:hypothetical protein